MKNLFSFLFILTLSTHTIAQKSVEMMSDSVAYLTAEQEAFMIDKETKSLLKTGPLQYERKLSNALSINLSVIPNFTVGVETVGSEDKLLLSNIFLQSEVELRYYYKLPRLIKEGKQANNLSSSYFGLGGRLNTSVYKNSESSLSSLNGSYEIYGVWGDQRRFMNYGFLDYGLELSYQNTRESNSSFDKTYHNFLLRTKTKVGIAFGKKYDIDEEAECPIFRCYLDRKSALRVNFNSLLAIAYGKTVYRPEKNTFQARINPNLSYEFKLGSSPFSINQDLNFSISFSNRESINRDVFGISAISADYALGGRYYYKMKSNIKKGKSGNNLSGTYFYTTCRYSFFDSQAIIDGQPFEEAYQFNDVFAEAGLGYQRSVLNGFYFNFQIGLVRKIASFGDNASDFPVNIPDIFVRTFSDNQPFLLSGSFNVGKMF